MNYFNAQVWHKLDAAPRFEPMPAAPCSDLTAFQPRFKGLHLRKYLLRNWL